MTAPAPEIPKIAVILTVVGGRIVHGLGSNSGGGL
jgi:hypothetical protein